MELGKDDIREIWKDGLNEGCERSLAHETGNSRKKIEFEEWYHEWVKLRKDYPLPYCPKCNSALIEQHTKSEDMCKSCGHVWDIYRPDIDINKINK